MGKQQKASSYDNNFKNRSSELDRFFKENNVNPEANKMYNVYNAGNTALLGTNTGFGESKYDKDVNWFSHINENDVQGSINENRYDNQSGLTQLGAGVVRAGTKAVIEVLKMPGYIGGAIAAPFAKENEGWETMTNNWWVKGLNNINEEINTELLPVYVGKAIKEGNLWDNITSTSFWATEGADGIGYIASMFVPGAAFKMLGLGHKAMGTTAKALSYINGEQKLAGATRALTNMGITANKFDIAGTALVNSMMESSAEAGGAIENFDKQKPKIIDGYLKKGYTEDEAEQLFTEQKGQLGSDIFKSNMAILMVPNLIQSSMIWGKAGNKLLSKIDNPSLLAKIGNRGKDILGATASEGFLEEAGQSTVENMFTNKAKQGTLTGQTRNNFNIGELADNYLETISSVDGQKAMFLGAFLGGGMSAYHGGKQDISDRKANNDIIDFTKPKVDNFNKILETDIYKRNEEGDIEFNYNNKPKLDAVKVVEVAKALQLTEEKQKEFEQAVNEGNTEVVEELKQEAITQLISPFITQGELGIQSLEQHLQTISKAEEIQGIKKPEEIQSIIKDAVSQAKYMQDQLQSYEDFSKDLINLNHPDATKQDLTDAYNQVRDTYVNLKGVEFSERKKLKELEIKKAALIKDLPSVGLSTELNPDFIESQTEDLYKNSREAIDPRLQSINSKIEKSNSKLKEIDKAVNESIWNPKTLNESFANFVTNRNDIRSKEVKEYEYKQTIETIGNTETEKELNKIKSDNPEINRIIEEKRAQIRESERLKDEAVKEQNKQDAADNVTNGIARVTPPVITEDIVIEGDITKDPNEDVPVKNNDNKSDVDNELNQTQPGAKITTYNRFKGYFHKFITDTFIAYEQNGKDKSKDKVEFKINNTVEGNENWSKATEMFNSKDFSDLDFLYKHLPIDATIGDVFAPIETEPTDNYETDTKKNPVDIFERESLPMRKAIIDALAKGALIESISTNIVKQFPGVLKVQPQIENEDGTRLTPENSVKDLNFFKSIPSKDFLKEFVKRAYFVYYDGQLTSVNDLGKKKSTSKLLKGKGEVYIEIPQNNGNPFMLKLNFKRIEEDKAGGIYEVMKALSDIAPTEETPNPAMTNIEDFLINLPEDIQESTMFALAEEIKLVEKMYPDKSQQTIDRLLDLLVHQKSKNPFTLFNLDEGGNLNLGSLSSRPQIAKSDMDSPESKAVVVEFLKNKRHNVLITEAKGDKFTFNNADYVNYLLDNNIISTNAVVNEPTFQGYSNIYLNRDVKIDNVEPKTKPVAVPEVIPQITKPVVTPNVTNKPDINYGENVTNTNSVADLLNEVGETEEVVTNKGVLNGNIYTLKNGEKYSLNIMDAINGEVNSIDDRQSKDKLSFSIRNENNENIGNISFWQDKDGLFYSNNTNINPEYQRKGIATITYDYAESLGVKIKPSVTQTKMGESFFNAREQRKTNPNFVQKNIIDKESFDYKTGESTVKLKEDVKVNTFNITTLTPREQMKVVKDVAKELSVTLNNSILDRVKKGETVDIYNELVVKAKEQNKNIDDIIKKCN